MDYTFATATNQNLEGDDALLFAAIKSSFPQCRIGVKSFLDSSVDWTKCGIINLKTAYGYYRHKNEFIAWLRHLSNITATVYNPIDLVLWNLDKSYLKELEAHNISILPTIIVNQHEALNLPSLQSNTNWHKLVIKPTISAGGNDIFLYDPTQENSLEAAEEHIKKIQQSSNVLIQKYMPSIGINGEYSAIFIGGEYSYLIHKKPTDNFIASYSKGIEATAIYDESLINFAKNIFTNMPKLAKTLYARVDMVIDNNTIYLMELELIEPRLFFDKVNPAFMTKYIEAQLDINA
jgi:glutathione synthase/RimK-type ligase-like ATP-grasp enzyme